MVMLIRIASMTVLCAYSTAWAVDPDILLNDQTRQTAVAPLCHALVVQSAQGSPEHTFHKALCLLYGLQTAPQLPLALGLLRQAAGQGWVEAQVTLGDTLQRGTDADQREALRWYASAVEGRDVRAAGRLARLIQRRNAAQAAKDEANTQVANSVPTGVGPEQSEGADDLPFKPQGYHCHVAGLGKKYCHSVMD